MHKAVNPSLFLPLRYATYTFPEPITIIVQPYPEFQEKHRELAIQYYRNKKDDPEFQAKRRKQKAKYYQGKKNDPEFQAKRRKQKAKYYQGKKNDPEFQAKRREQNRITQRIYQAKKKLEKQNNLLNNSTNENLNLDQSNQTYSSFLTINSNHEVSTNFDESNQAHSTHLEFLMTNNIAENQNNINYIDNTHFMTEEEIDALLDEINNYPSQVGNNDNADITPQNISNKINFNNVNNIAEHPKSSFLYDSDDDQNNFSEPFSL